MQGFKSERSRLLIVPLIQSQASSLQTHTDPYTPRERVCGDQNPAAPLDAMFKRQCPKDQHQCQHPRSANKSQAPALHAITFGHINKLNTEERF